MTLNNIYMWPGVDMEARLGGETEADNKKGLGWRYGRKETRQHSDASSVVHMTVCLKDIMFLLLLQNVIQEMKYRNTVSPNLLDA